MPYREEEEKRQAAEYYNQNATTANSLPTESHLVYELKQKREYLLRQLFVIQQAIDAVNLTTL